MPPKFAFTARLSLRTNGDAPRTTRHGDHDALSSRVSAPAPIEEGKDRSCLHTASTIIARVTVTYAQRLHRRSQRCTERNDMTSPTPSHLDLAFASTIAQRDQRDFGRTIPEHGHLQHRSNSNNTVERCHSRALHVLRHRKLRTLTTTSMLYRTVYQIITGHRSTPE